MDALVSAVVKALVIFTPLFLRTGSYLPASWVTLPPCWALPLSQQIAGAAAAALPLCGQLLGPGYYYATRDAVLATAQALLLAVLRQALLLNPGSACTLPGQPMFGIVSAVLLVSFQQRMSWAVWQPTLNLIVCVLLSSCGGDQSITAVLARSAGGAGATGWFGVPGLLQHLLLPLCALPLMYAREQIDRWAALGSFACWVACFEGQ
jgi:hypothetical protein